MSVFFRRRGKAAERVNYVEYIQSNRSQCINTEIYASADLEVEIKFRTLTDYSAIMGAAWNDNGYFLSDWGGALGFQSGGANNSLGTSDKTNGNTIKLTTTGATVNGVPKSVSYSSANTTSYPIYLFGVGSGENSGYNAIMQLFYCRMRKGGTLIRDFWPCYDPDGVACLYDKVEKKYYYNAGTGEFIAGGAAA